jgi:hypothetical protein
MSGPHYSWWHGQLLLSGHALTRGGPCGRPRASTDTIDEVVGRAARRVERSGVRSDDIGRPDPRPTSRATCCSYRGLWEPIATCHDGQRVEWSPRGGSRSPCMGWAKLRASSHFGHPRFDPPLPATPPWHPKGNMRPLTPTGGPPGPPAKPWTGMWAKLET